MLAIHAKGIWLYTPSDVMQRLGQKGRTDIDKYGCPSFSSRGACTPFCCPQLCSVRSVVRKSEQTNCSSEVVRFATDQKTDNETEKT